MRQLYCGQKKGGCVGRCRGVCLRGVFFCFVCLVGWFFLVLVGWGLSGGSVLFDCGVLVLAGIGGCCLMGYQKRAKPV